MTRKKTKFCLSWPKKTLKISGRLRNIGILFTERTIMPYWNLILPPSSLFYRMWRHFSLDDLDTQKVPGVAECSPLPLKETHELIFSWLSWLAVLLTGAHHNDDDGDGDGDGDDGGVAQHGGRTPNNGLTEICSLGLLRSSLILDIHVIINWHLSKQGIRWPVSREHIEGSS